MTRYVKAHFDGKFVVIDETVNLAVNQPVTVAIEENDPKFGTVGYILENIKDPLPDEDAEEMRQAIEEACEQIEPEPDVNFE